MLYWGSWLVYGLFCLSLYYFVLQPWLDLDDLDMSAIPVFDTFTRAIPIGGLALGLFYFSRSNQTKRDAKKSDRLQIEALINELSSIQVNTLS